jgi:hypothetical protein
VNQYRSKRPSGKSGATGRGLPKKPFRSGIRKLLILEGWDLVDIVAHKQRRSRRLHAALSRNRNAKDCIARFSKNRVVEEGFLEFFQDDEQSEMPTGN